jgi:hypothetical protein
VAAETIMNYSDFLHARTHLTNTFGFAPTFVPSWLFDFQGDLVEWATRKGRAAIFGDCGLGKTPMQLVWAQNVIEHANKPVLIVAPLAASAQTMREAAKFNIDAERSRDGQISGKPRIVVTNYERLEHFDSTCFAGMVCDESSILKNFDGVTKQAITDFMRRLPYRLLCTATAAPNDYIELGTSSEALGDLGYVDMLGAFFTNDESSSISPMAYDTKWRLKGHAERPFWRWVCSWARAFRRPSDLGFGDGPFILPGLTTAITTVQASRPFDGYLFVVPASTLDDQRAERRATIRQRCETVAEKAIGDDPFIAWCHLNDEGDLLEELIPGAEQVSGSDSDERKEEIFEAFTSGQVKKLVTKPRIGAFGMNWQHCWRMSFFPSHSYEQYYQAVRRCWRFGQRERVVVDVITTAGEADVLGNLTRKAQAADRMFALMVEYMREAQGIQRPMDVSTIPILPTWMNKEETVGT